MMPERDASARFGALRSALHAPPSRYGWAMICALLEGASPEELQLALLPYLLAALEPWPDALRRAPRLWLERLDPRLVLTRHVALRGGAAIASFPQALAHRPEWSIRALDLFGALPDEATAALLAAASRREERGGGLVALGLHDAPAGSMIGSRDASRSFTLELKRIRSSRLRRLDLMLAGDEARFVAEWLGRAPLPALKELRLALPPGSARSACETLAGAPLLATLEHLTLRGPYPRAYADEQTWEDLSASSLWRRIAPSIRTLALEQFALPARLSSSTMTRAALSSLTSLRLERCVLDEEALRGLLALVSASPLEQLALIDCGLTERVFDVLRRGLPRLGSLHTLTLSANRITLPSGALTDLLGDRPWPVLKRLNLSHCDLLATSAERLEDDRGEPLLPALERLTLSSSRLSEHALYALTRSALPRLETLHLSGAQCPDYDPERALKLVLSAGWLSGLRELSLPDFARNQGALEALLSAPFDALRRLVLDRPTCGREAFCETLRPAPWLERLEVLRPDFEALPFYQDRIPPQYEELLYGLPERPNASTL